MRLRSLFVTIVAVFGLLLFSTSANAATCKECPSGCVAEQLVAALESDEELFAFDKCPTGCVAVANVKFFHDKSVCEEQVKAVELAPVEPVPVEPAPVVLVSPEAEEPIETGPVKLAPCIDCPSGCISVELVESYKVDSESLGKDSCPPGCASLLNVKSFLDKPACKLQTDSNVQPDKTEDELKGYAHQTDNRITVTQTAFGLDKGEFVITGYGLGIWELQYGISDFVQLGVVTMIPAGAFTIIPTLRLHKEIKDSFAISAGVFLGYMVIFIGDDVHTILYGGSVEGTFNLNEKHFFNVSLSVLGLSFSNTNGDLESLDGAIIYPSLGYRGIFHRNWSFQLEVSIPLYVDDNSQSDRAIVALIFYGVRGHGETIFGSMGFIFPVTDSFTDNIWKFFPLGVPYFSLGFAF